MGPAAQAKVQRQLKAIRDILTILETLPEDERWTVMTHLKRLHRKRRNPSLTTALCGAEKEGGLSGGLLYCGATQQSVKQHGPRSHKAQALVQHSRNPGSTPDTESVRPQQ